MFHPGFKSVPPCPVLHDRAFGAQRIFSTQHVSTLQACVVHDFRACAPSAVWRFVPMFQVCSSAHPLSGLVCPYVNFQGATFHRGVMQYFPAQPRVPHARFRALCAHKPSSKWHHHCVCVCVCVCVSHGYRCRGEFRLYNGARGGLNKGGQYGAKKVVPCGMRLTSTEIMQFMTIPLWGWHTGTHGPPGGALKMVPPFPYSYTMNCIFLHFPVQCVVARLALALVWAGAWLRPTHPTVDHRAFWGGENGHGCSRSEHPWLSTTGRSRGRASLRLMYVLWRA